MGQNLDIQQKGMFFQTFSLLFCLEPNIRKVFVHDKYLVNFRKKMFHHSVYTPQDPCMFSSKCPRSTFVPGRISVIRATKLCIYERWGLNHSHLELDRDF